MLVKSIFPNLILVQSLLMTEEGPSVLASSFACGLHHLRRPDALEVDPVSLGIANRQ